MMKRLFSLLLSGILLLTLTSCKSSAHHIDVGYDGEIRMTDGQAEYTAQLSHADGVLTVTMTAPEELAGVAYEYRGGELSIMLNGMKCITDPDSLPDSSCISLLYDVLSNSDKAEYQKTENGVDIFSVKTDSCTATITAENGDLKSITSENDDREILFS